MTACLRVDYSITRSRFNFMRMESTAITFTWPGWSVKFVPKDWKNPEP